MRWGPRVRSAHAVEMLSTGTNSFILFTFFLFAWWYTLNLCFCDSLSSWFLDWSFILRTYLFASSTLPPIAAMHLLSISKCSYRSFSLPNSVPHLQQLTGVNIRFLKKIHYMIEFLKKYLYLGAGLEWAWLSSTLRRRSSICVSTFSCSSSDCLRCLCTFPPARFLPPRVKRDILHLKRACAL